MKPSLAPVVLWPIISRRWRTLASTAAFGVAATLVGEVVAGPGATRDWLRVIGDKELSGYWDNASLSGSAARLFRENGYAEPIAIVPGALTAAVVLGLGLIAVSAWASRKDPEMGLWALAAASLLASPVSWHNYLTILGPGVLLLLARGRTAPGCLLLALGTIPLQYASLWDGEATVLDKVALSLYTIILIAYWFAFIPIGPNRRPKTAEEPLEKDSRPAATSPYFD